VTDAGLPTHADARTHPRPRSLTSMALRGKFLVAILVLLVPACHSTDAAPTAHQLLAKVGHCHQKLTKKALQTDENAPPSVNVCAMNGAVFMKADMDVDCDGQITKECNSRTDCCFQNQTAFDQSNGRPLSSAKLPYIVLPEASKNWNWSHNGIGGGSVVAVIYHNKVEYAIFGDTDSPNKAGEASYATAKGLGIDPDPRTGGAETGVTYIVFEHAIVDPIESHRAAVSLGEKVARRFIEKN
jgi:glycosyl hydrolase group 75 (putative chitosanase)